MPVVRGARGATCFLPVVFLSACATANAVFAPPPPAAPSEPPGIERAAFVVRVGSDTVAVEQFTRTSDRIEGRQVVRTPRLQVREYAANLAPDGAISRFTLTVREPAAPEPVLRGVVEYRSIDARVEVTRDSRVTTQGVPIRAGAIPSLSYSLGLYDALLRWFWPRPASSVETSLIGLAPAAASPVAVRRAGADAAIVAAPEGESRVRLASDGRIVAWNGVGSSLNIVAQRTEPLDFDALASDFAARELAGHGLGTLSPADSVRATVAGAHVAIDYGRPARRGRVIFGNIVPWNRVWRTGAGAATGLRTSRDLVIGGTRVPAGLYTLWTIPTPTAWTLIVSRETGADATYDPASDLARIPMLRETLPNPLERFTIGIEIGVDPQADGTLWLGWDDTRASVPFRVLRRSR